MGITEGHEVTLETGTSGIVVAAGALATSTSPWYKFSCSCGYDWGQTYTTQPPGLPPRCPRVRISQEDCESIHGHCYEQTGMVLTSNPPQYPEVCKHCGKRRVGVPQAARRYYDPDEPLVPAKERT